METLLSIILNKVADCFVGPIKTRAGFITGHKDIKEQLKNEHAKLISEQNRVQNEVQQAKNSGEKITREVDTWLKEVEDTGTQVTGWLTNYTNAMDNSSCGCGGLSLSSINCCRVYKLSKEAMKKKVIVSSQIERGSHFSRVSWPTSPKGIQLVSSGDFTAFNSMTLAFNDILRALGVISTRMVGVLGMGGIGKTTLVKQLGRVAKEQNMFDQVVFAVVSQTLDVRRVQGQLGDMLGLRFSRESDIGRAGQLSDRLKLENKVLVILDDVWNAIDLGNIGIPFGNEHQGCKILITTRREHVCSAMNCQETIKLNLLEENEAWDLFKKNAGDVLITDPSSELEDVAKQIVGECQGLPLALVVVGCALRDKGLDEWIWAAQKLERSRLVEIEGIDINVYACFKLSFNYLKSEDTKMCFLLCSLFPEDHEIDIEELAKYAMGVGMCQDVGSFILMKTRVHNIVRDLKASSLLLKTDNMANHVKMHDMVRDAALWITGENKRPFVVPVPTDKHWAKNEKALREAMAISLLARPMTQRFPQQAECPMLKMLLVSQRVPLPLSDNCFKGMTTLRVLDLTAKHRMKLVLPKSIQLLENLRTLHLRRWLLDDDDIAIIGSLKRLEILSFSGSVIWKLPEELAHLKELRVLDLSGCAELLNSQTSYTEVQRQLPRLEVVYTPNMAMMTIEDDEE